MFSLSLQLRAVHGLLFAMGNTAHADSQRQAGIALEVSWDELVQPPPPPPQYVSHIGIGCPKGYHFREFLLSDIGYRICLFCSEIAKFSSRSLGAKKPAVHYHGTASRTSTVSLWIRLFEFARSSVSSK